MNETNLEFITIYTVAIAVATCVAFIVYDVVTDIMCSHNTIKLSDIVEKLDEINQKLDVPEDDSSTETTEEDVEFYKHFTDRDLCAYYIHESSGNFILVFPTSMIHGKSINQVHRRISDNTITVIIDYTSLAGTDVSSDVSFTDVESSMLFMNWVKNF